MVGFWYNKELFAQAGHHRAADHLGRASSTRSRSSRPPGITPIALAGKEKWPGHFYWAYLAMRIGGLGALQQAGEDNNFATPDFVAAGQQLKELVDLQPFQKGFLGAEYGSPDGQAATMGNGGAAMELMGQWAPVVQAPTAGKRASATSWASSRSRRSRAARARSPRRSAAATASPWARTPRRRRSTS